MLKKVNIFTRADAIAIVFFILTLLFFFQDFLFNGFIFFHNDLPTVHYPLKSFLAEEYSKGNIPLWNPYTGAGSPTLAYGEILPFYFLNIILFLILPISKAITIDIVLHLFIGGLSLYFFMRIIGIAPIISLVPTITFIFSALCILHIHILNLLIGITWMPCILTFLELYFKKKKLKFLFLASCIHIIQFYGGHPQAAVYSFSVTIPYFTWRFFRTSDIFSLRKKCLNYFMLLVLFLAPIPLISALELTPTAELTLLSIRKGGASDTLTAYITPPDLLTYFFPTWYLGRNDEKLGAVVTYTDFYWDLVDYVGLISFILAFIAIFKVKNDYVDFFTLLFLISSILRLGPLTPLNSLVLTIPGFKYFLNPSRFSQNTTLSLAILAGFGLKYLVTHTESFNNFKEFLWKRFIFICFAALLFAYPYYSGHACIRCVNVSPPSSFIGVHSYPFLIIVPLFIVSSLFIKRNRTVFLFSTLILIICDLFIYGINYNPRHNPEEAAFNPILSAPIKYLKQDKDIFRIYPYYRQGSFANETLKKYENILLVPDLNGYYGISSTLSRLSLSLKRLNKINDLILIELKDLFRSNQIRTIIPKIYREGPIFLPEVSDNSELKPEKIDSSSKNLEILSPFIQLPIFDVSNIKYLLTPENLTHPDFKNIFERPIKVYENKNYLPRAYFVDKGLNAAYEAEALKLLKDRSFNFKQEVILEDDEQRSLYSSELPIYRCQITKYSSLSIEARLETNKPGYFILSDTYYPGWSAKINKKPAKILIANYLYRALRIENPGKYTITFEYKPFSYKIGLYISLLS
ncbi:YfhO family protein, partial [bacterium]|nr:YfhO family protein [bacterium]